MLAVKHPLSLIPRPSRLERAKQNAANPQTAVGNFEKRGTRKKRVHLGHADLVHHRRRVLNGVRALRKFPPFTVGE